MLFYLEKRSEILISILMWHRQLKFIVLTYLKYWILFKLDIEDKKILFFHYCGAHVWSVFISNFLKICVVVLDCIITLPRLHPGVSWIGYTVLYCIIMLSRFHPGVISWRRDCRRGRMQQHLGVISWRRDTRRGRMQQHRC